MNHIAPGIPDVFPFPVAEQQKPSISGADYIALEKPPSPDVSGESQSALRHVQNSLDELGVHCAAHRRSPISLGILKNPKRNHEARASPHLIRIQLALADTHKPLAWSHQELAARKN